jgi:hypothetical protein
VSDDLPVRGARARRERTLRASRGFSPRRALAALALLASAGLTWGATASPAFDIENVEVEGAVLTEAAAIQAALDVSDLPPNAFLVATDALRDRLLALPAIADAEVHVGLPGRLLVRVVEREPVLVWRHEGARLLVDGEGRVFADAAAQGASAAAAAARGLPAIVDRRGPGAGPAVGEAVDPLEFDVATRLLPLVPADVGSAAPSLRVRIDHEDGWTIRPAVDDPWVAVFGFYGLVIRPPAMIPEQVRLLRSLLMEREATIQRVVLAGPRAGTFTERPAP